MSHTAPYPPFALPQRTLSVTVASSAGDAGAVGHVIFAGEMNKRSALGLLASAAARQCRCWDLRRPNQPLSKEALEELAGAARDRS